MTRTIKCQVNDEFVVGSGVVAGAAGSHDDVLIRFEFSPLWDGTTKTITWLNALGENPTITIITADMLEAGTINTYNVPIPFEPKEYAGNMLCTIKGVITEGSTEKQATMSAVCQFTILPSAFDEDAQESGDITPTQAEQIQQEIDNLTEIISEIPANVQLTESYKNQAGQYASNASTSATSAHSYMDYAEGFSNTAQGHATQSALSASASASSATEASGYADNASASASEASDYADNASDSASEASGYALDAHDSAEDAAEAVTHYPYVDETTGNWFVWNEGAFVDTGVHAQGEKGDKGDAGNAATISVGTTTTGQPGTNASVTNVGTSSAAVFNFTIPKGQAGTPGASASVNVGTTTTGAAGTNASVINRGTSQNAILDFTIPRGSTGAKGDKGNTGATGASGSAATISVGSVTTVEPGQPATVTNRGTSAAAIFDFSIPKGAKGDAGEGTGDMLASNYDPTSEVLNVGGIPNYVSTHGGSIDTIKVNGTTQPIVDKAVNVTVPTKTSDINNDSGYQNASEVASAVSSHNTSASAHSTLFNAKADKNLLSPQTTVDNPAADKAFVNSSIENVAAYYITKDASGNPFATKAELTSATVFYSGGQVRVPTRNDYCVVLADESKIVTETGEHPTTRYIYGNGWSYQYIVNRSGLTAAQWAAANSNITASKVSGYDSHIEDDSVHVTSSEKSTWNAKQSAISDLAAIRSNASAGATHAGVTTGNPHQVTYQQLGGTKPSYTASEVGADASGTAASAVSTHNSSATAHQSLFNAKAPLASPAFTGTPNVVANTNYTTAMIRNIVLSTEEPDDSQGSNGDIWLVYEE